MKIINPKILFSAVLPLMGGMIIGFPVMADSVINQDLVVKGEVSATFEGVNDVGDGLTNLADLTANNTTVTVGKGSDAGFSVFNEKVGSRWNFRTLGQNFAATKEGTGGAEMRIVNATDDFQNVSIVMGNGAQLTSGGVWQNASSKTYKENIQPIMLNEALQALEKIEPVKYQYKRDESKELNLGFIAEDVPELVSTPSRKNMDPMEVVAMLTTIVKNQQQVINSQQQAIERQNQVAEELMDKVVSLEKLVKLSSMVALQE